MLCRYWFWGLSLAASSLLLAGCGTLNRHARTTAKDDSEPASATNHKTEQPAEKVAQAHAHFAAGVIHDMNDETEAALEEFYKAGLADIQNEGLVLEVTRRLLQNKQQEKALD